MIKNIIDILQSDDFFGAGKYTELAKGKNEYISTWREMKYKMKRLWQSKK